MTDTVKLVKLLQLTQSTNDNEALAASRAANALLAKHKMNWDELFRHLAGPPRQQIVINGGGITVSAAGYGFHW